MDPFDLIPDDKIYELCEGLSTQDLSNFMRSKGKIYQLCSDILEKRKINEQEARDLRDKINQGIRVGYILPYVLNTATNSVSNVLFFGIPDRIVIWFMQKDAAVHPSTPTKTPWLLQGLKNIEDIYENLDAEDNTYTRYALLNNNTEITEALNRVKNTGYILEDNPIKLRNLKYYGHLYLIDV